MIIGLFNDDRAILYTLLLSFMFYNNGNWRVDTIFISYLLDNKTRTLRIRFRVQRNLLIILQLVIINIIKKKT